jgi:hypothetical protein
MLHGNESSCSVRLCVVSRSSPARGPTIHVLCSDSIQTIRQRREALLSGARLALVISRVAQGSHTARPSSTRDARDCACNATKRCKKGQVRGKFAGFVRRGGKSAPTHSVINFVIGKAQSEKYEEEHVCLKL